MDKYYFLDAYGKQQGPVEMAMLSSHGIGPDTLVWTKGMVQWQPAKEVIPPHLLDTTPIINNPELPPSPPPQPQDGPQGHDTPTRPNNYLVWSILVTIFCFFLPGGIAAIVYSSKVNSNWEKGNYAEAEKCADRAKMWCFITGGVGVLGWIVNTIFFFIFLASQAI